MFLWRNKKDISIFRMKKAPCVAVIANSISFHGEIRKVHVLTLYLSVVILEGDLGEKVSLSWLISPCLELGGSEKV